MKNEAAQIVGDFSTPDVFADESATFDMVNGTVRITFVTARPSSPAVGSPIALVAVNRLIMPIAGAQRLALGLHDYLTKHGLDPRATIRSDGLTN